MAPKKETDEETQPLIGEATRSRYGGISSGASNYSSQGDYIVIHLLIIQNCALSHSLPINEA